MRGYTPGCRYLRRLFARRPSNEVKEMRLDIQPSVKFGGRLGMHPIGATPSGMMHVRWQSC